MRLWGVFVCVLMFACVFVFTSLSVVIGLLNTVFPPCFLSSLIIPFIFAKVNTYSLLLHKYCILIHGCSPALSTLI